MILIAILAGIYLPFLVLMAFVVHIKDESDGAEDD